VNDPRADDVVTEGMTVRAAHCDVPEEEADIVTPVDAVTEDVVMLKAAVMAPDGTVIAAGTAAALGLELVSATTVP